MTGLVRLQHLVLGMVWQVFPASLTPISGERQSRKIRGENRRDPLLQDQVHRFFATSTSWIVCDLEERLPAQEIDVSTRRVQTQLNSRIGVQRNDRGIGELDGALLAERRRIFRLGFISLEDQWRQQDAQHHDGSGRKGDGPSPSTRLLPLRRRRHFGQLHDRGRDLRDQSIDVFKALCIHVRQHLVGIDRFQILLDVERGLLQPGDELGSL